MTNEDEELQKLVELQNKLKQQNKSIIAETIDYAGTVKQEKPVKDLTTAKNGITIPKCKYCGNEQRLTDTDIMHNYYYNIPLPVFDCGCDQAQQAKAEYLQEQERIAEEQEISRLLNQVNDMLPKRFKESRFNNFVGHDKIKDQLLNMKTGLYLAGNIGAGKTHLAIAYLRKVCIDLRTSDFIITSVSEMINGILRDSVSIDRYKKTAVLLIDDLGAEELTSEKSQWKLEQLFEIINYRYMQELIVIITTNLSKTDMQKKVGSRIMSRLTEMCNDFIITGEDYRRKGGK